LFQTLQTSQGSGERDERRVVDYLTAERTSAAPECSSDTLRTFG
jgi:hypothetical protein